MMRWTSANTITLVGHAFFVLWLLGGHWAFALAALLCDLLDGHVARRFKQRTRFGSLYDWTVDVTCCAVALAMLSPPYGVFASLVAVPMQVHLRRLRVHFSGRTFATLLLIGLQIWKGLSHG